MILGLRNCRDIYILDVKSDMDLYNAHELKAAVAKLMDKKVGKLIINLENVEYIDSSGIGVLIHIFSSMKKRDCQLKIVGVHGSVAKVIKLTKLTNFFPIVNAINDAIHQLS